MPKRIQLDGMPRAAAIDARSGHIFVTCWSRAHDAKGTVVMLDAATAKPLRTIMVGGAPSALAVDAPSGTVFVLQTDGRLHTFLGQIAPNLIPWSDDTLSVLRSRDGTVLRIVKTGSPHAIAIDIKNQRVFVANTSSGTVSVLSPS